MKKNWSWAKKGLSLEVSTAIQGEDRLSYCHGNGQKWIYSKDKKLRTGLGSGLYCGGYGKENDKESDSHYIVFDYTGDDTHP